MDNTVELPKFNAGDIIDLSYLRADVSKVNVSGHYMLLSDRIMINAVYRKVESTQWMYHVDSEAANGYLYMTEEEIEHKQCSKNRPCYKNKMVKNLYKNGYRFCGNHECRLAVDFAKFAKNMKQIDSVVVCKAISGGGDIIRDEYGVWVKYKHTLDCVDNDGIVHVFK